MVMQALILHTWEAGRLYSPDFLKIINKILRTGSGILNK
jgi:hypothetical protein